MSHTETVISQAKDFLLQNYKQQPIVLARGEGSYVWDAEGRRYLDLIAGIATCALGHCNPAVTTAAKKQLDTLWHTSNVFYTEPQIQLAARLTKASGLPGARAFFCNSGAEANEALIKLARRYQHEIKGNKDRSDIITFEGGFHGRTLATVTATAQPKYQAGFEPLPQGFTYAQLGDLEGVKKLVGPTTAAILVEPIQGEGGVRPAPAGFLKALRELCDANDVLLLIDEVQTGIGRTGKPFAFQHEGIVPDAFSLAKSLGNGLPIGAMVCSDAVSKALTSGTHGSTFGGNLVAAAAAVATWDIATTPEMLAEIAAKGEYLRELATGLQRRKPERVKAIRGKGMLFGIEVDTGAAEVLTRCRENGLLANLAGEKTIRFAPSYLISREQLADGIALLEKSL
ncbi:MAG: aspartate aminotransferase family protein [Archangium gephyra]|uniref:Acetylornithine aminotransferase n=1 Tax=Archangium gephyra TaxID=48 RepID=A0A2W5V372_9BACT|nr:MAG: aspartate aminotransferase family protein [Archangium gephyra]